jgi:uncharacterized protein involved in type VI secretion and phage assembly
VAELYGPVYGKVTANQDPDALGRVKVIVDTMGEAIETDWIPVMQLYGSSEVGAFFIPEVDDIVLVTFMANNSKMGVVLGGVYTASQLPPETGENTASDVNQDGENNLRFIKSRSGHMLIFDDKSGEEKIQIISHDGNTRFEFLAADEMLNIETDKDLRVSAKGKLAITAEEGEFTFEKALKIEGDAISFEAKGKDLSAKAGQNITLEGTSVILN